MTLVTPLVALPERRRGHPLDITSREPVATGAPGKMTVRTEFYADI